MTTEQILTNARAALGIAGVNDMQQAAWHNRASRIVLLAPTGSGKTLALAGALGQRLPQAGTGLSTLILAPSRELVIQIAGVLRGVFRGYKTAALYGKHSMSDETASLQGQPDIVVATPGRLLDHINRKSLNPAGVRLLAIDEYDKALELGFAGEMSRICRRLHDLRFIMLTSATPIETMPDFLDMTGAEVIDFASSAPKIARLDISRVESPVRDKLDTLVDLLCAVGKERTIVFVNHRDAAERVHQRLEREGFGAGLYHGGLEQQQREEAVICLENGSKPILVATDLASRGLDIDAVGSVVHYHMPPSAESWTHRNGRTARQDATGRVFVITTEGEDVPNYVHWDHDFVPPTGLRPSRPDLVTLYINAGRREKISRGDILGFLIQTAGLDAGQIGKIALRDHASYVAVARTALGAISSLQQPKIKGKRVRISILGRK